jgi:uncharacterized RDD family membrane protein YckC
MANQSLTPTLTDLDATNRNLYAGFWRRVAAYCVDMVPIVALIATIAYQVGEFDAVLANHFHERRNVAWGVKFLLAQKIVSEASFLVYILYASFMESSRYQATVGKLLFHMKVINAVGGRLTLKNAMARNWAKLFSWFALCLGFLAIAVSTTKQGWHDKISNTYVIAESETL